MPRQASGSKPDGKPAGKPDGKPGGKPDGKPDGKKRVISKSQKAGLTFPVSRFNRYLKTTSGIKRVGGGAPVYLAAVLEYIAAELMEVAGNSTKKSKRKTISPDDISCSIRQDTDLNKLFSGHRVCVGDKLANVTAAIQCKVDQKQTNVATPGEA